MHLKDLTEPALTLKGTSARRRSQKRKRPSDEPLQVICLFLPRLECRKSRKQTACLKIPLPPVLPAHLCSFSKPASYDYSTNCL